MKKQFVKIFFVVIAILLVVFATTVEASGLIDQIQNNINTNTTAATTAKTFGKNIIGAIQVAGTGIAVIMLLYIAIKYLIAAPSEKAEFKKTAVNYVIGAVILFASMQILKLVQNVMENLTNTLAK